MIPSRAPRATAVQPLEETRHVHSLQARHWRRIGRADLGRRAHRLRARRRARRRHRRDVRSLCRIRQADAGRHPGLPEDARRQRGRQARGGGDQGRGRAEPRRGQAHRHRTRGAREGERARGLRLHAQRAGRGAHRHPGQGADDRDERGRRRTHRQVALHGAHLLSLP